VHSAGARGGGWYYIGPSFDLKRTLILEPANDAARHGAQLRGWVAYVMAKFD
jgi:hypothetical protein